MYTIYLICNVISLLSCFCGILIILKCSKRGCENMNQKCGITIARNDYHNLIKQTLVFRRL